MTKGFRVTGERQVFDGHVFSVAVASVTDPDGHPFEREVVRHPGAVEVVPLRDDGTVVMIRQYRTALGRELLEVPAGKCDVADEPLERTAHRELAEEVGLRAGRLDRLGSFHSSPGFCDEEQVVFLAQDLTPCDRDAQGAEERYLSIEHVPLADVPALIARGELTDAGSVIGLLLARDHLG